MITTVIAACLFASSAAVGQAPADIPDALRRDIGLSRERVYPALVNITAVQRYFSGGRALRSPAGGSGVIVTEQGHVLTNFHVAGHTTRIQCVLPGGEAIDATVVVHDPMTDLSVLKLRLDTRPVPGKAIPHAELGDSDQLKVGDYVLAMGNPLRLSSSLTLGVVSNPKRVFTNITGSEIEEMDLDTGETTGLMTRWIQHDALILPGNSGGPLVNLKGEVVGINELGGSGVGFAIPSNIAKQVLAQALTSAKIERGWLGLTVLPVDKLGLTSGALVGSVAPGSAAATGGVQAGDIITAIGGEPVTVQYIEQVPLLQQRIAALKPGAQTPIKVTRDGKPTDITVTVAPMAKFVGDEEEVRSIGATVQEITAPMAMMRRLPAGKGVLVTGVRPGYPLEAAQPKVQPGDVIMTMGGQPTTTIEGLRKALAGLAGTELGVVIRRDEETLVTLIKPLEEPSPADDTELPRPWLGAKTQVVTPEVSKALKLAAPGGFRVTQVYKNSEAGKAGIVVGDIIVAVNGRKTNSARTQDGEDLRRLIEDLSVGDKAKITVMRTGKPTEVVVPLQPTPRSAEKAKQARQAELEFTVRELTAMDRMTMVWVNDTKGVLVTDVVQGGWAHMAGLLVDDIVPTINGRAVTTVDEFQAVMADMLKSHPKVVTLFVRREFRTHFVFIEPDWTKLADGR